jgi:hypothetical protein
MKISIIVCICSITLWPGSFAWSARAPSDNSSVGYRQRLHQISPTESTKAGEKFRGQHGIIIEGQSR